MGDDGTYRYTGVSCDAATIISGGKIVTSLIDVTSLFAQDITLNPNGYIQSSNYRESGGSPASGFKIDAKSGTIKSYGMVANSMTAVGGTFTGATVGGVIDAKVFHFSQKFSKSDTGYTDSAGTWHDFENGDMWLVEV